MSETITKPSQEDVSEVLQHFGIGGLAPITPEDLDDILQHHGVKGQRWGVIRSAIELARAAGRSVRDTVSKGIPGQEWSIPERRSSKARARDKIEKLKLKKEIQSLKSDLKNKPKKPQDMTDDELRDHFDKTLATQKLVAAAKSTALDPEARARAEVLLKNRDTLSLTDYKIESSRIEQRAKRLEGLLPSNNKKPGFVFNTMVGAAKQFGVGAAATALTNYAGKTVITKLGIDQLDPEKDKAAIAELRKSYEKTMSYINFGVNTGKGVANSQLESGLRSIYGNVVDSRAKKRGRW